MQDKIWGVLAGGALGDAMGMPTECWSQEKINKVHPNGVQTLLPSDVNDAFGRTLEAGSITDDTINVLMIAEMINKNKGQIKVEDYVAELVDWNENSGVSEFVSGPSTLRALKQISEGVPISKTGISGTTNGASMKIAPIGIIANYEDMNDLVTKVHQICMPTHNAKIAIQGASAVAASISYTVRGGRSIERIWEIAYDAIDVAAEFGYDFPSASLKFRMDQARKIIQTDTEISEKLRRLYEEIGSGMETIETIPCTFAIVELAQGDPVEAAKLSAMIGWDTDTIGAISASICGGMNPEIPQEMISTIEKVNHIDLTKLSNQLSAYTI